MSAFLDLDATAIAEAVRQRRTSATAIARAALDRIGARDPALNCFTATFPETALDAAGAIDRAVEDGRDPGPLAGVPFAVKNLYDVVGVTTLAGSKLRVEEPPATRDATVVARLRAAGAVLVGVNNMDEFAYGFTTENEHYGASRNPHDPTRSAGGSSGGSAAAVAARMVPLSLGTDTNGSIRVPASLCGIFGLKPTLGRLSRDGVYPFVTELDHVGLFARSVRDLAAAYDSMQGPDPADRACADVEAEPVLAELDRPDQAVRAGLLGGWFRDIAGPEAREATDHVASLLGAGEPVVLAGVAEARAADFCLTAASGAAFHLETLRAWPAEYDPATRDRFFAGALLPNSVVRRVAAVREWFRDQLRETFRTYDVLIAPATPCPAPLLGQTTLTLGEREVPLRPNLGVFTQPLSFIGLPVVTVPVLAGSALPIGIQIIAPAWREATALKVAARLERQGVAGYLSPRSRAA